MNEKDFRTLVLTWLVILTLVWVGVLIFWRQICERAALTTIESIGREVSREVTTYRPEPAQHSSLIDYSEVPKLDANAVREFTRRAAERNNWSGCFRTP